MLTSAVGWLFSWTGPHFQLELLVFKLVQALATCPDDYLAERSGQKDCRDPAFVTA